MQSQIKEDLQTHVNSMREIWNYFYTSYSEKNNWKYRLMDAFIVYNAVLTILQVAYVALVGTYPMNAFLSGVICCVGSIVLTGIKDLFSRFEDEYQE